MNVREPSYNRSSASGARRLTPDALEQFSRYLAPQASGEGRSSRSAAFAGGSLRRLWEASGLSAQEFADEAAAFFKLPRISLADILGAKSLAPRFSRRFLREASAFPFETADGGLRLAMADPTDREVVKAARLVLDAAVEIAVASFEDVATALSEAPEGGEDGGATVQSGGTAGEESVDALRDLAAGAPVVRAVNDLIERAVELRASDIHIEPQRAGLQVRMRVDGLLRPIPAPAHAPPQAIISRIKILAGLNIAERRLPQDGAARLAVARSEIDVRVATMPTQHGEAAVIRLLPRDRGLLEIPRLGFGAADGARVRRFLDMPHGMIVVTGPTGSGKTTTLATVLTALNTPARKILTIEDPVEYEIAGIGQSQVKPSIGLSFATALRAFVRQDPDVIMVGEVRDAETANVAVHAALTGHLVLTTLHTETAPSAAPRLLDLGVEGFLLRSVLRGVVGQRLVRILCERCKTRRTLNAAALDEDPRLAVFGFRAGETLYEPKGCERCAGAGYRGRVGVFEVLEVAGEVRDLVGAGVDSPQLDAAAQRAGMTTMMQDAVAKARAGVTSAAEAFRVTTVR